MEGQNGLSFHVGQCVESKSHVNGFRGAWFRSKVEEIKGDRISLSYIDFPDEKRHTMKPYQKAPRSRNLELMLRPSFPLVVRRSEFNAETCKDLTAVVNDQWQAGDHVDAWIDECYWQGVIESIGGDTVTVKWPKVPDGEGGRSKNVLKSTLRPSLCWCPKTGWFEPALQGVRSAQCVQVVHPKERKENTEERSLSTHHERQNKSFSDASSKVGSQLMGPSDNSLNETRPLKAILASHNDFLKGAQQAVTNLETADNVIRSTLEVKGPGSSSMVGSPVAKPSNHVLDEPRPSNVIPNENNFHGRNQQAVFNNNETQGTRSSDNQSKAREETQCLTTRKKCWRFLKTKASLHKQKLSRKIVTQAASSVRRKKYFALRRCLIQDKETSMVPFRVPTPPLQDESMRPPEKEKFSDNICRDGEGEKNRAKTGTFRPMNVDVLILMEELAQRLYFLKELLYADSLTHWDANKVTWKVTKVKS